MNSTRISVALALIVTLLIASCGEAPTPAPTSAPAVAPATAPAAPAAAAPTTAPAPPAAQPPAAGQKTLIVAVSRDLQNLDPTTSSGDPFTQEIMYNVYRFLINFRLTKTASGEMIGDANNWDGDVAESYQLSPDGKKLTFKIRKGIKFSNGDPIDANAVKFTYDRIFDSKSVTAGNLQISAVPGKDSIKVLDDYTVEFNIDTPNTILYGNISQFGNSILNPKVVKPYMTAADPWAHEWLKANTKGTESGPYLLESWQPGVEFVLAKNPNWWGEPPKMDRVVFRIVPDPSTRLALLKSGAVDIAKDIAPRDLVDLEKDPNIKVNRFTTRIVSWLGMNVKTPPFDNVKVRQAISYALPYETIIKNVLYGYGRQLTSVIPDGTPTHTDEFFVYKTDPAKAKSLLAEAGYPNGLKINMQVRSDLAETKATGVWVKSELAKAGIDVTIQEMEGAAFTAALQKHELAFFQHPGWITIANDPIGHVYWLLYSDCCDYSNYRNQEIDDLIQKYILSTDVQGREAASRRIQQIAAEDAAWGLLYQPDITLATRSNVKGVVYFSADRDWRYQFMYKE